tara:strand:- start:31 stop:573 length:543 start_codon:yes stop_codon:yes gene_type:complete
MIITNYECSTSVYKLVLTKESFLTGCYFVQHSTLVKTLKSTKTKLENNWKAKTLENLEKDYWAAPTYDSQLVKSCHKLRKKPLKNYETEDLRIMIGQNIGLKYLIPLALEALKDDILVEGDFYAGDLLKSVLTSDIEYWSVEQDAFTKLQEIISENKTLLSEKNHESLDHFDKLSNSINF